MSNKKIYKNRLSLPIFDNKGIGNGNGVAYIPNVIRGGSAIPIGNNMFLMRGRSHAQGGIDIGKDLEVEGNEVVQNGKFGTKVFSSVPFLRGVSPAERVLRGENPDTVFAAQEAWKRVNKVADDGSKRAALGLSLFKPNSFKVRRVPINDFIQPKIEEIETPEVPTYVLKDDEKPVGKKVNPNVIGGGRLYNGYAIDNHEGENVNGIGGGRVYNDTSTPTTHALPGKNKYSEEEIYNQRRMGLDSALDELHISSKDREKYYDLLIPQSVLEPGWTIPEDNNYFGHLKVVDGKRVKIRYANPKDAWLKHIKNLNTKWPNWITANNQKEYFDIINNESLGLHTLQDWKDYVAKNPTKNAYIYAPAWENNIKQYVDSLNSISNKFNKYKAFGGDKTYVAPKWAQDSYKKYGKVIIGGTPVINPYLQGSAFALMRNPLLRTLTRDAKNLYSALGTGIQKVFVNGANRVGKLIPNKYLGSYDKLINNIYSTFIGDASKDILKETRKGWKYYPNLERLPATINNTVDTVNNIVNEKQFGGMKLNIFKLGGLSRSKDYGSKDKPYPSVNKNDFAGGGRSYPIPTRADAVDALRLAGLHHRSDVRAKVYAKYPDLRKKAKLGKYAKITGSPTNEKVVEPVRTNYVERNNSNNLAEIVGKGVVGSLIGGSTIFGLNRLIKNNKIPLSKNNPFVALNYDVVENPTNLERNYNYPKRVVNRIKNSGVEELWDKRRLEDATKRINSVLDKYGDKIKVVNEPVVKEISSTQVYDVAKPKKYTPNLSEFSPKVKAGVQQINKQNLNLARRLGTNIRNIGGILGKTLPGVALVDFVRNLFPSKQQEQEADKAWRRYKSSTGRIPEDYQMKFGGLKKAPYGDYITIGGRRVPLVFDTDNKRHDISDVWHYLKTNANPGDLAVNQYEEHPLFRGFYHRENRPMFSTNPMVARWYNYGWSHNAGEEVPYLINSTNVNNISNTSTPVQTSTFRQVAKTSTQKNNTPTVSPAVQRILNNAEIAPYQTFRTPSLAEVASHYPISERINVGTSTAPISSSTGVQLNPADVEAVRSGNFAGIDNDRYLPIRTTTEDWVGLGANLLGSIGSYLGTRAMLNRYPMPNKPIPAIAQKLKTRININPQLDTIREQVGRLNTSIDNNTSSSRVAQARKQGVMNNAVASRNQLYGQKENAETQLINQDIMNRQRIGLYNNQIFNDYLTRLGSTRQYIAGAGIDNINNLINGANQSIQDLLGRIEDRDAERRNFIFMQAAYPNVNWRNIFQGSPELARSLGFRFV